MVLSFIFVSSDKNMEENQSVLVLICGCAFSRKQSVCSYFPMFLFAGFFCMLALSITQVYEHRGISSISVPLTSTFKNNVPMLLHPVNSSKTASYDTVVQ